MIPVCNKISSSSCKCKRHLFFIVHTAIIISMYHAKIFTALVNLASHILGKQITVSNIYRYTNYSCITQPVTVFSN